MPLFGAHLPVAGGLHKAAAAAAGLGLDTVQVFTSNPNAWSVRPAADRPDRWVGRHVPDADVRLFRQAVRDANLRLVASHDSYLINLASPDAAARRRSVEAFVNELERAEALGLSYVVTHPGAHVGSGVDAGVGRVAAALDEVHTRTAGFKVTVLLETTAGSGTTLGARFEELAAVLDRVKDPGRLGVCLDTCHVFAAGYPLAAAADYAATFQRFDDLIGLGRLQLFHVNDSVKGLGSRVDRHAGIGLGEVGLDAFRRLVTDSRFADRPMVLETPKEDADGNPMDPVNLAVLKGFLAGPGAAAG